MGHPSVYGNHSLEDCKHLIRDQIIAKITVRYLSTWMVMYTGLTLDPVQNIIVRIERSCALERDGKSPKTFFRVEDLPRGSIYRSIRTSARRTLTSGLFDLLPKGWQVGLMFSGCDPRDKRQDMGKGLSWKAKEEAKSQGMIDRHHPLTTRTWGMSLGDEVWGRHGVTNQGRASQLTRKMTTKTLLGYIWVTLTLTKGSLGIDTPDQVNLTEFVTIYRPLPMLVTPRKKISSYCSAL